MSQYPEQFEPDPVIEAYKRDIDRTLIRETLRLTVEERFDRLMRLQQFAEELQRGRRDMEVNSDLTKKYKGKRYQMKDGTIITVSHVLQSESGPFCEAIYDKVNPLSGDAGRGECTLQFLESLVEIQDM
jgi:hypothetical protein